MSAWHRQNKRTNEQTTMVRATKAKINKYKCVACDLLDTNCPVTVTSDDTHIIK